MRDTKLALQRSQLALQSCYVSLLLHHLLLQCLIGLAALVHICTVKLFTQLWVHEVDFIKQVRSTSKRQFRQLTIDTSHARAVISGMGSYEQQPGLEIMQRQRTIHTIIAQTYGSGGPLKLCWGLKTCPATQSLYSINTFEHV